MIADRSSRLQGRLSAECFLNKRQKSYLEPSIRRQMLNFGSDNARVSYHVAPPSTCQQPDPALEPACGQCLRRRALRRRATLTCARSWRSWRSSWPRTAAASRTSRASATPRTAPSGVAACAPACGSLTRKIPIQQPTVKLHWAIACIKMGSSAWHHLCCCNGSIGIRGVLTSPSNEAQRWPPCVQVPVPQGVDRVQVLRVEAARGRGPEGARRGVPSSSTSAAAASSRQQLGCASPAAARCAASLCCSAAAAAGAPGEPLQGRAPQRRQQMGHQQRWCAHNTLCSSCR